MQISLRNLVLFCLITAIPLYLSFVPHMEYSGEFAGDTRSGNRVFGWPWAVFENSFTSEYIDDSGGRGYWRYLPIGVARDKETDKELNWMLRGLGDAVIFLAIESFALTLLIQKRKVKVLSEQQEHSK